MGQYSPEPAVISVIVGSVAVCCTEPVPPPLTSTGRPRCSSRAVTTAGRRLASSSMVRPLISRIAGALTPVSGTPATWAS